MKIAIIGASHGIGNQLLWLALAEGHEVTALLRKPGNLNISDGSFGKQMVKYKLSICP